MNKPKAAKRQKALRTAVDTALAKIDTALAKACVDLQQQFSEFTADEIARAVFVHAPRRREREALRKAREAEKAAAGVRWAEYLKNKEKAHPDPVKAEQAEQLRQRHEQAMRAIREMEANAQEERRAKQQIVSVGYKAMAAKLHPDIGGSTAAMQKLNKARDALKRLT